MKFTELRLKGAYIVEMEPHEDDRGFFARSFCQKEFQDHGLATNIAQCNVSSCCTSGVVRGMHYQVAPHEETKLVRCTLGAIQDVMIDIRPDSPTYKKWWSTRLSQLDRRMVYVPRGFAHGYLSLTDNAMVLYMVSEPYHPECERTIRWNDPAIGIEWARMAEYNVSEKDKSVANI